MAWSAAWSGPVSGEGPLPGFAAVDAYTRAQMENVGIPGLALGVVQDGRPVHLAGFGRADDGGREPGVDAARRGDSGCGADKGRPLVPGAVRLC